MEKIARIIVIIIALVVATACIAGFALQVMHQVAVKEFGEGTRIGRIVFAEYSTEDHIVIMSPFNDGEDVFLFGWDVEEGRVYSDGFYFFWNTHDHVWTK